MPHWTQHLRRPQKIENLYEQPPSLEDFELLEISWDSDEDACILRGTLARFADFPESQWEDDANRVGIRLWLENPDDFSMQGWSFDNLVDIDIDRGEGTSRFVVEAVGDDLEFRATCRSLQVSNIFAYHAVEDDEAS